MNNCFCNLLITIFVNGCDHNQADCTIFGISGVQRVFEENNW
jgi:hypothetical protein